MAFGMDLRVRVLAASDDGDTTAVVAAYPGRLVESQVLKAMEPASLELSLRAADRAEHDR